jgi:hypothetical protein
MKDIKNGFTKAEKVEQQRIKGTLIYKSRLAYMKRLTYNSSFQERILEIRKTCGILEGGLKSKPRYKSFWRPGKKHVKFPKGVDDVSLMVRSWILAEDIGLDILWSDFLVQYALYNDFNIESPLVTPILVSDVHKYVLVLEDDMEKAFKGEDIPMFDMAPHPIAIFIDPYTPKRELQDYIAKVYETTIKPIQDWHRNPKIQLGKIRRKDPHVSSRNNFIIQNRNLPISKLVEEVRKHYEKTMDYTYIQRIVREWRDRNGK